MRIIPMSQQECSELLQRVSIFTAIIAGRRPAFVQVRACRHASRSTHWAIGRIKPQSSATAINSAGETGSRLQGDQRNSAAGKSIR